MLNYERLINNRAGIRGKMSFIKTWFPEIPREDLQQIIGVHRNFHIAHMESLKSLMDDTKNTH